MIDRADPKANGVSRGRVIQAATQLFAKKGFAATGIREIAENAGLSTSSLYHYMGTKEELLLQIMTDGLTRFVAAAMAAVAEWTDPACQIVALTRVHVAAEATVREPSVVIDNEVRSLSPPALAAVLRLRDQYEGLWGSALEQGSSSGTFVIGDLKLTRLALLEMCNGVARWFHEGGPLALPDVADTFASLALAMVRSSRSIDDLGMRSADHEISLVVRAYAGFAE